jgi:hypothetical protein
VHSLKFPKSRQVGYTSVRASLYGPPQ